MLCCSWWGMARDGYNLFFIWGYFLSKVYLQIKRTSNKNLRSKTPQKLISMRILMHVFSNFRSNQLSWTTYGQTATVICILKLMRHQVISGTKGIWYTFWDVQLQCASTMHLLSIHNQHFFTIFTIFTLFLKESYRLDVGFIGSWN